MRQRPIGVRTRIFAAIGVLWGSGMVISSLFGNSSVWRGIAGVVFILIAGYWLFTRDKSS
jgi:hypothetical protein